MNELTREEILKLISEITDDAIQRDFPGWVNAVRDNDAAQRATIQRQAEEIARLKEAMEIYKQATYQSHLCHWDNAGGSITGCPECIRAREARDQAQRIVGGKI